MFLAQARTHLQPVQAMAAYKVPAIMHEQSDIPDEYRDVPVELLKKGSGRFSHIVLVPQPTDDPNDPLNVSNVPQSTG